MSTQRRIDWHSYAMFLAWAASARSEAVDSLPADDEPRRSGAAVLEKDSNRVLALGYNGFLPGFSPPNDFYSDRARRATHLIHAETNALSYTPKGQAGLIAVTLAPCAGCARAIVAHQIPLCIYGEDHPDQSGLEILRFYGIEVRYLSLRPLLEDWIKPAIAEFLAPSAAAGGGGAAATASPLEPLPQQRSRPEDSRRALLKKLQKIKERAR